MIKEKVNTKFEEILEKAKEEEITAEQALHLFYETESNYAKTQELFKMASKVRDNILGTKFKWTGGMPNILPCRVNPHCMYCPYWIKKNQPFSLSIDEVLEAVSYIKEHGMKKYHLSSGTMPDSKGKEIVNIVKTIRSKVDPDSRIHVNCGAMLSRDSVRKLKKLGVTRITVAFETINEKLFQQVKPGDSLEAKKKLAEIVNDEGLELSAVLMAGLSCKNCSERCLLPSPLGRLEPFGYEEYVDFMFYVKRFKKLRSILVTRFHPYEGIPMEDHPLCSEVEVARIIAIMRLVFKNINIGAMLNIPLWVMAGGGDEILGVGAIPSYRYHNNINRRIHSECKYHERLVFYNTISTTTKFLREMGMSVEY